jgi:hypothetical protein
MGLLDDAIREHLDLKRRRGADPAEVARTEQEALGPVRREAAEAPEAHAGGEHHDEPPVVDAHEQHHDEHAAVEEHHEPEPVVHEHPAHEPADPADAPANADPRQSDLVHQPTTEFHVEDHHDDDHPASHAAPDGDEDVLEETPDFLQETPEHDRLWFEQRPPRDFDFDA